jgi:hypothetical protein
MVGLGEKSSGTKVPPVPNVVEPEPGSGEDYNVPGGGV